MNPTNEILKLRGKVQHYAWGGFDYIPALLQVDNPEHKPYAEYWMGAHPGAPSLVQRGADEVPLNTLIASDPATYLGQEVYDDFGELPYLFKVLDVREMLSIQVHPTREEAIKGFDAEEAAAIPINAADRNYKDRNHKPEVMVALGEFWLLHGFKTRDKLLKVLNEVEAFHFLIPDFGEGYYQLYKTVMELPQEQVDEILRPLVQQALANDDTLPGQPAYWIRKLYSTGQELTNIDRGIFSIYFFNIVQLQAGEAIFQGAGVPHAYLQGQNIELMANSDNVLRGGLTPKHIDVPELLKHTLFEGIEPNVLKGEVLSGGEVNYPCPVSDFAISKIDLLPELRHTATSNSAEIFIVTEGELRTVNVYHRFKKGDCFFVPPATSYELETTSGCTLFKAFVPA
ncbi:mannose-6-phosphate isomerase, class I [Segetibacter sp. 3557_3]|uniref:mannose-6-phosphate isomerase, class I n=1 Tax=Segetibacter sp. 3557_3 TaxID=2547429 RepID=UPI001058AB23|nr:mannose-6-phosphate isomerase, class I [Segetibacter sp. 3557_3]TDH25618.1 mannose-6-phosphate isomerase, class I [Segetibacter sp. 3557_3]